MAKITEAFDSKRREFGEVKFSETSLNDPHVKKIIDEISKQFKIPKQELIDGINKKVKEFDDIAKKSPILYETIQKNAIEQEVFDLMEKHDIGKNAPRFDIKVFSKLIRFIKVEHDQFFPLRNFIDHKYLYKPVIVIVPSPRYPQYASIDTACATPNGEFVFNKDFMQKLIDYANIKGVRPKGKKYASNGGEIPDEYAYIEFLIIHEFMHYTYADFHYQKELKANPKIINWVGDFRSNYLLVKSGFEQLPIGLFSDHVNYDRQKSYREMYDIVKAEFDKLNKDQQQKVSDALDGLGDDHSEGGEGGEGGEGQPGGSGGEGQEDKDPLNKSGKGKGKGEGKPGKPGKDERSPEEIFDEMDKANEEMERKMGQGKEMDKEAPPEKPDPNKAKSSSGRGGKGGRGSSQDGAGTEFDYSKVKPTFTWQKLLARMITDSTNKTEETYQKPHRRNITGVDLARQTGAAAMKPGEVPLENELKLAFVVDSSGSMTDTITTIYSNIENLLRGKGRVNKSEFYLIKFSGSHHIYKCNFSGNKYKELASVDDKPKTESSGSVKDLFSKHIGSATNFTDKMTADIEFLAKKKYNVLLMSDSDILSGENFVNVKKLLAANKNIFIILDSRETYVQAVKLLRDTPKNITYFD